MSLQTLLFAAASAALAAGGPSRRTVPLPGSEETGTLIVTNMSDNTATLIDLANRTVRATVPTGKGPHEVAASSDGRWAVVTNYGDRNDRGRTLTVIDLAAATVARTIDLEIHERPHGIAFSRGDSLLFVTSETSQAVVVVRFADGRVVGAVSTERPASHMLALSANGRRLFTTNVADGSITAIDPNAAMTLGVTPVAKQVEGIAISPDGKRVWVGSNGDSVVVVLETEPIRVIDTLPGFGMPYRLAISPNGRIAVISDPAKGQVRVVDAKSRKERRRVDFPTDGVLSTAEFPGSASPEGVVISGDSRTAYVTLQGKNRVAAIDLDSGAVLWDLPVGAWPDGIAYAPSPGS